MALKTKDDHDIDLVYRERDRKAVRSVHLIQHAQYSLSLQEQRLLLYCISKVQPNDTSDTEYHIQLKDYLAVCGLKSTSSYQEVKNIVMDTFAKMVLAIEGEDSKGNQTMTVTNWFNYMRTTKGHGKIDFKFSEQVYPYLLRLANYNATAEEQNKLFYVSDELKFMLPMKCRSSFYLYPLLRSYQNVNEWTFPIEPDHERSLNSLRELLDVYERIEDYRGVYDKNSRVERKSLYTRYVDFRRYVLDPAVDDINRFSNIKVVYKPRKTGRAVTHITFYFENKNTEDRIAAETRGRAALDKDDTFTQKLAEQTKPLESPLEFHICRSLPEGTIPPSMFVQSTDIPQLQQAK